MKTGEGSCRRMPSSPSFHSLLSLSTHLTLFLQFLHSLRGSTNRPTWPEASHTAHEERQRRRGQHKEANEEMLREIVPPPLHPAACLSCWPLLLTPGVQNDGTLQANAVRPPFHKVLPPPVLQVLLQLHTHGAIVIASANGVVDLAAGENDCPALAEIHNLFHGQRPGGKGRCCTGRGRVEQQQGSVGVL